MTLRDVEDIERPGTTAPAWRPVPPLAGSDGMVDMPQLISFATGS
ncbi:hypothetical protein ACI797_11655 [Geodermatophilus sp. SYSU D00691]